MVKLIVGNRGTGKTKALLNLVNDAAQSSKGHVVCIEKGDALKFDLSHKIRLIDIEEYNVQGADAYYGFIAGLLAGNYDITDIFCDATFKILCGKGDKDINVLISFLQRIAELMADNSTVITFSVSCDPSELPEDLRKLIS